MAAQATYHCLIGCGIGEVVGIIIGTALLWGDVPTIVLALSLGVVFGLILGIRPWLKAGLDFGPAFKRVVITEGLSIVVMETAEVLTEVYMPGVMSAGLTESIFWLGMLAALCAGFIAAYPVNYVFAMRGIGHAH